MELWNFRNSVRFMDFKELLSWFITEDKNVELFAVTAWSVWNQRNQAQLNQPITALHQVALVSKAWWQEFRAQQVDPVEVVRQGVRAEEKRWRPPSVELVKINFDGAVFANENESGIGVVIRNDEGLVLASCAKKIPVAYSECEIETMAATTALSFTSDIDIKRAILKGDSLAVIKALREDASSLSPFGLLIDDVKSLANSFDELSYSHTKREGNQVAHGLTKYAKIILDFVVWMENVPPQLFSVLQADLLGIH